MQFSSFFFPLETMVFLYISKYPHGIIWQEYCHCNALVPNKHVFLFQKANVCCLDGQSFHDLFLILVFTFLQIYFLCFYELRLPKLSYATLNIEKCFFSFSFTIMIFFSLRRCSVKKGKCDNILYFEFIESSSETQHLMGNYLPTKIRVHTEFQLLHFIFQCKGG